MQLKPTPLYKCNAFFRRSKRVRGTKSTKGILSKELFWKGYGYILQTENLKQRGVYEDIHGRIGKERQKRHDDNEKRTLPPWIFAFFAYNGYTYGCG